LIWTVLKIAGVILLLFAAYVVWFVFRMSSNLGESPMAHAEFLNDRIRVTVSFPEADSTYQITEVLLLREAADDLGVSSPHGFSLSPYTLDDTGDPASEESADWVTEANRSDVRWVGRRPLTSDAATTLDFPTQNEPRTKIVFRFQYERKLGMGGETSFFSVAVEPPEK